MNARAIYIVLSFAAAIPVGLFGGQYLYSANTAVSSLIDVFAILAAVLVAVISIIGDPAMLLPGGWRVGYVHAQEIQGRIARFSHLFFVYILTLATAIVAIVVKDSQVSWASHVFQLLAGMAAFSFLLSVPLPYVLMSIQTERMKEAVKKRKENGG